MMTWQDFDPANDTMIHDIKKVKLLDFQELGDDRGHLVVAEAMREIPFVIQRIFYIYESVGDVVRGQHANRQSEFVLINVSGKSKVRVDDGMGHECIYQLDRPHIGIYLPKMIWKDMYDFSNDSVLLVLANTHYDASEYIRSYDDYVLEVNKLKNAKNLSLK